MCRRAPCCRLYSSPRRHPQICALFANNMLNIQQVLQMHCPPDASLNRRCCRGCRVPICFVIVCTANNEKIKGEKLNRGDTVMQRLHSTRVLPLNLLTGSGLPVHRFFYTVKAFLFFLQGIRESTPCPA